MMSKIWTESGWWKRVMPKRKRKIDWVIMSFNIIKLCRQLIEHKIINA